MLSSGSKIQRILKGAAWVSVYTGLYRVATLLVAIMSARLLDVTDYGKVSILQSTSSLFIMFATLGLGTVAIKLVAENNQKNVASLTVINLLLGLFAVGAIYVFSPEIAESIYQDSSLETLLKYLTLFIFLSGATQIQSSILAGKEDYRSIAKVNLVTGILSIALVYLMIKIYGIYGWIYGLTALELLKLIVFQLLIHKRLPNISYVINIDDLSFVAKLAVPIALSGLFILPVNWLMTRELLIQSGYSDVALLNISDQWIAVLTFFPIAIGNAMLPIMSRMQANSDRDRISNLALKMNVVVCVVLTVPVIFIGEFLLGLYGQAYVSGGDIFFYILPLVLVLSMTNQLNNRVVADGRPTLMMYSNLIWLMVCLPIGMYLVSIGSGVAGVLLGRLAGYLSKFIFLYGYTRRVATS